MATSSQIDAYEKKEAEKASAAPAPQKKEGGFGSFSDLGQGAFRGLANLAPVALDAAQFAGVGQGGDQLRQSQETSQNPLLDRPDTFMGRTGERIGQGAIFGAAGLGGMGARAIAGMVASEVAAAGAGQAAEELGLGGGAQFAIEMGVGALSPGSAIGNYAESAATRSTPAVKRMAKKLGVSEKAILRAADFHRNNDFDINPMTGKPDLDVSKRRLRETLDTFADDDVKPSTRQALSRQTDEGLEDAPAGIAAREQAMARPPTGEFSRKLGGRKKAVLRQIEQDFETLQPGGSFGTAQDAFIASHDASSEIAETLWDAVDLDAQPAVSTKELKKAALAVRKSVGQDHRRFEPDEVQLILNMPDEIPASRLQSFRSNAMKAQRIQGRGNAESVELAKAKNMGKILKQLHHEVDNLPEGGNSAYRKAREATRLHYEVFDPESVAIRSMSDINDGPMVVRKIINSGDSGGEARKLIRALEQTPQGADGFRQATLEELTGHALGDKGSGGVIRRLRQKEAFYTEVLGEEKYGQLLKMMRKWRIAQVGPAGTAAGTQRTGSFFNRVSGVFAGMGAMMTSGGVGVSELAGVVRHAAQKIDDMMLNKDVMAEFMLDPEAALILLEAPTKKTIPVWTATFDMVVARALSRRALAAEGAAAARSGVPDRRDFQQQQAQQGAPMPVQTPLPQQRQ